MCEDAEQPDEIVKELAAKILPTPMPLVRTKVRGVRVSAIVSSIRTDCDADTMHLSGRCCIFAGWLHMQTALQEILC